MFTTKRITAVLMALVCVTACKEAEKNKSVPTVTTETPSYDSNDVNSILTVVEFAHGGWNDLLKKQDVQYHYEYRMPKRGAADVSTERYIFETESSFGSYVQNDINAKPKEEGKATHFFNGDSTIVKVDGTEISDERTRTTAQFVRRANYFWFVMPYKLNDKGTIAKYLGREEYKEEVYDKIEITYDPAITGKTLNDTYILFVNPKTKLIDRFFFSLPFLGISDPVIIADYSYEEVGGQKLATKRDYFLPNAEGTYGTAPDIEQTISQITFNNGFTNENITSNGDLKLN
ncbi:DUF6503 family protein [uncultured Croceitalea sp.]|uniref:DUF6503 family protein n=1 Tax=uncultured Croceitalea sp. TaxID=1798908 RepID=UPI00330648F6